LVLLLLSVIAVVGVAHQTKIQVHNKTDLQTLTCGWPLQFIENDQSWRDPPFPWEVECLGREWGGSLKVLWLLFSLNVIIFYMGFALLWSGCRKLFIPKRKRV
jgi:hypothetical protein